MGLGGSKCTCMLEYSRHLHSAVSPRGCKASQSESERGPRQVCSNSIGGVDILGRRRLRDDQPVGKSFKASSGGVKGRYEV